MNANALQDKTGLEKFAYHAPTENNLEMIPTLVNAHLELGGTALDVQKLTLARTENNGMFSPLLVNVLSVQLGTGLSVLNQ